MGQMLRQGLDGDRAIEFGIAAQVDHIHAAAAYFAVDGVLSELGGEGGHEKGILVAGRPR